MRIFYNILDNFIYFHKYSYASLHQAIHMKDDGVPAIQFKLFYTSFNWGLDDVLFVWRQDNDEKCLLPDGIPKPCKPNSMRNRPEIIKGISGFIDYWKELCEENITKRVRDTHEPLSVYWDHICSP